MLLCKVSDTDDGKLGMVNLTLGSYWQLQGLGVPQSLHCTQKRTKKCYLKILNRDTETLRDDTCVRVLVLKSIRVAA